MDLQINLLLLLSTVAYVSIGLAVGFRLTRLARRGPGRFAERMLGLGCLTGPGLVAPCLVFVHALSEPEALVRGAAFLGQIGYAVFSSVMVIFTWKCFRPDEAWARWLASGAIAISVFAAGANMLRALGPVPIAELRDMNHWAFQLLGFATVVIQAWTGAEAFGYYARMRRRRVIGLADPVVANRFLLWGLVALGALTASGVPLAVGMLGGDSFNHVPTRMVGAAATIFSSVCLQLAFLPPPAYVNWLRARAASP